MRCSTVSHVAPLVRAAMANGLKERMAKNGDARRQAGSRRASRGEPRGERAAGVRDHRGGPEHGPLPRQAPRRRSAARPAAGPGRSAATVWLPPPACPSARGGLDHEPQEDPAALWRRRPGGGRRRARRPIAVARTPIPRPDGPNSRWSTDFVHDQLANGRRFRGLTILDDVTRERLAAVPDTFRARGRGARCRR